MRGEAKQKLRAQGMNNVDEPKWAAIRSTYPAFHLLPAFSNSSASSKKSFSLTGFYNAHLSAEIEGKTISLLLDVQLSLSSTTSAASSILEPWYVEKSKYVEAKGICRLTTNLLSKLGVCCCHVWRH